MGEYGSGRLGSKHKHSDVQRPCGQAIGLHQHSAATMLNTCLDLSHALGHACFQPVESCGVFARPGRGDAFALAQGNQAEDIGASAQQLAAVPGAALQVRRRPRAGGGCDVVRHWTAGPPGVCRRAPGAGMHGAGRRTMVLATARSMTSYVCSAMAPAVIAATTWPARSEGDSSRSM